MNSKILQNENESYGNNVTYKPFNNRNNIYQFKSMLNDHKWNQMHEIEDLSKQYQLFSNKIFNFFYTAFPKKSYNTNIRGKNQPWITKGMNISSQKLKELFRSTFRGDANSIAHFKKYQSMYRKILIKAKNMYYSKLMEGSNNKNQT